MMNFTAKGSMVTTDSETIYYLTTKVHQDLLALLMIEQHASPKVIILLTSIINVLHTHRYPVQYVKGFFFGFGSVLNQIREEVMSETTSQSKIKKDDTEINKEKKDSEDLNLATTFTKLFLDNASQDALSRAIIDVVKGGGLNAHDYFLVNEAVRLLKHLLFVAKIVK